VHYRYTLNDANAMKLQPLSRFAATKVLLAVSLAIAGSTRVAAQSELRTIATDAYRNCQQRAAAVVTLYSGAEIGSGSIVRPDGLIITNHHVVQESWQDPGKIKIYVKLADGARYLGQAIAADPTNDLALVRIRPQSQLQTIPLAAPSNLRLGQPVCAIGNPFGISGVLSLGKVSAFRGANDLKSAVFLSRGNSGGPLLNEQGEMIGVNKSIWLSDRGENTGTSFATKVQVAQDFIQRYEFQALPPAIALPLLEPASASPNLSNRSVAVGGVLGAIIDRRNLIVRQIVIGSPADRSGLRPGDRLIAIDQQPLNGLATLQSVLQRRRNLVLTVDREQEGRSFISVNF